MKTLSESTEKYTPYLRITVIFLIAAALLIFVNNFETGGKADNEKRPSIYFVGKISDPEVSFWITAEEGIKTAAEEFNVDLHILKAKNESAIDENLSLFKKAVSENPDAIVFCAADLRHSSSAVAEALKKGIKVVMVDSYSLSLANMKSPTVVSTNNYKAGEDIAEKLAEDIPSTGKVAVIVFNTAASSGDDRMNGVLDKLQSRGFENISLIDAGGLGNRVDSPLSKMINEGKVDAVIALNEYTSNAAVNTLESKDPKGKIPLYSIDFSTSLVPAIERGRIHYCLVQQPFTMGYRALESAVNEIEGKALPPEIYIETLLISKKDLYNPKISRMLFSFDN